MNPDDALEKAYGTSKIISTAMAGSLLIYVIIVEVLKFQEITFNYGPCPTSWISFALSSFFSLLPRILSLTL